MRFVQENDWSCHEASRGELLAEIRDLKDALTAANQSLAAARTANAGLGADLNEAEAELQHWRTSPFMPRDDYQRALARAESAERTIDALTRQIQAERDRRGALAEIRALHALRDVLRVTGRTAWGPEDASVLREARAVLAEAGFRAPEVDERRARSAKFASRYKCDGHHSSNLRDGLCLFCGDAPDGSVSKERWP